MKAILNLGMAAAIIVAFIYSIYQKEAVIAQGETVYLALAPVDPRSIMQGDYMRLRYEVGNEARKIENKPKAKTGFLVLDVDDKNIARFANFYGNKELAENQILFKYQADGNWTLLQPDSFLFQQGLRTTYAVAKYGIFKVDGDEHLLVGLADGDLNEIKPPKVNAD